MLDGYLCGVLLQPSAISVARWMPVVLDARSQADAGDLTVASDALRGLVLTRQKALDAAIAGRQWFDPWVYDIEETQSPSHAVLPWVAGFALAMERFPGLLNLDAPELLEPLALLYRHFDADDLEDADDLLEQIDAIEPAADLTEAVEDVVRSVLLLADVSRPALVPQPTSSRPRRASNRRGR